MSFVEQVTKSRNHLIRLVTGISKGRKSWYYIRVENSKFEHFKIKVKSGNINLDEYGEVLFKGWGEKPPADIQAKIDNDDF